MKEFADFLADQPPFNALDGEDLTRIVTQVEVEFFAAGAVVVRADERLEHLWVVRTGTLEVREDGRLVDLLHPGDTFGHVAMLSTLSAGVEVRAHGESLCLRIPDPRAYVAHPELLAFTTLRRSGRSLVTGWAPDGRSKSLAEVMRPIVWCEADDRIDDVARRIGAAGQSSALVRHADKPGIVTDLDFRRRVATGELPIDAPIRLLVSAPVHTISDNATQLAGLLAMVEHGIHHLVVVDPGDRPVGIVRVVDLAPPDVRDPILARTTIGRSTSLAELVEACRTLPGMVAGLRRLDLPPLRVPAIYSATIDAVVRQVLALRAWPPRPDIEVSWVLLGSMARREPLPSSDIDTALIWSDAVSDADSTADALRAEASAVLHDLRECGLTPCLSGANADNPLFSKSASAWSAVAHTWMRDPTREGALLLSAMISDSRALTNVALGRKLTDSLRSHTRTTQFLGALLDEALVWRPPTGFVRDFVVHHTGEHKGQLDLKRGGLAPIVSLARWTTIVLGDTRGSTPDRLARAADAGLLTTDESLTLARAFENVFSLVLDHEISALEAEAAPATFIDPRDLDLLARRYLRETFRAISHVQQRIRQSWTDRLPEARRP
jgi:CBS domain-containing protein